MVVCLVLKVYKPLLCLSIYFHRYHDGTCIDLVRFFLICKFSFFFQTFHGKQCQIHQADKLVIASRIQFLVGIKIFFVSFFDWCLIKSFIKLHIFKFCREGGMTTMVTPVSIKHADLCHGRIPLLGIFEVILDM